MASKAERPERRKHNKQRADQARSWIAWDGEGVSNPDGSHDYVLLANSTGGHIVNRLGLATRAVLDNLWMVGRMNPGAVHVMFSAGYDFNCWLKDLSRAECKLVHEGKSVPIGPYHVRYWNRVFDLERGHNRMRVWDVFGFYQSSFVSSLRANVPDFDGLAEIAAQKKRRSVFTWEELPTILHYCFEELRGLVRLCEALDTDLVAAGIGKLHSLHGAGSIAGAILKREGVRAHKGHRMPAAVTEAAYTAYAGGRIELWRYGQHRSSFHVYDLRSAYPFAMLNLPSLTDGEWERTTDVPKGTAWFAVYRVRFRSLRRLRGYPFFQRLQSGHILYPPQVSGWYWKPELDAALRCGFDIEVMDGWKWSNHNDVYPFAFVPSYFATRAALKAAGKIGAQGMLKLGLNSFYGKTAQTRGGTEERPPLWHQIAWAGYTTARTRAAVFEVAMQNPDAIGYIATDGIGSMEPLRVNEGKELGQWEHTTYSRALLVQAGVYFLWDMDGKRHDKYRGFDPNSIDPAALISGWRANDDFVRVPATRFITLGSALAGAERWHEWRTWRTVQRKLRLRNDDGGKREVPAFTGNHRPWLRLEELEPTGFEHPDDAISHRYQPDWESVQIDGVPASVFHSEIHMG